MRKQKLTNRTVVRHSASGAKVFVTLEEAVSEIRSDPTFKEWPFAIIAYCLENSVSFTVRGVQYYGR